MDKKRGKSSEVVRSVIILAIIVAAAIILSPLSYIISFIEITVTVMVVQIVAKCLGLRPIDRTGHARYRGMFLPRRTSFLVSMLICGVAVIAAQAVIWLLTPFLETLDKTKATIAAIATLSALTKIQQKM